jgi:hypothetical protein
MNDAMTFLSDFLIYTNKLYLPLLKLVVFLL